MEIILFEEIFETLAGKLPEMSVNQNISRKPVFGWGNADELRAFIQEKGKKHIPLIWLVPRKDSEADEIGTYQREVELNLCAAETRNIRNNVRVDSDYSYKAVLVPLWENICRAMEKSNIDPIDGTLRWQLFPNYRPNGQHETQQIWDVLKVIFTANDTKEYTPCKGT